MIAKYIFTFMLVCVTCSGCALGILTPPSRTVEAGNNEAMAIVASFIKTSRSIKNMFDFVPCDDCDPGQSGVRNSYTESKAYQIIPERRNADQPNFMLGGEDLRTMQHDGWSFSELPNQEDLYVGKDGKVYRGVPPK